MKVTVLVPARDEQDTIQECLGRVRLALELPGVEKEIIVIDDASRDATAELAAEVPDVKVLRLPAPRGKGAAVRRGLDAATGEVVLIQDADLEYDPTDYPSLLQPLLEGRARVVYGSRILGARQGRRTGVSSYSFYWGGRLLSWLTGVLYGARMTDVATGYKIFRTDLLRALDLQAEGFEFCPEVTGKLLKQGIPILEIPIAYTPRSLAEGKKIRWTDGWRAMRTLWSIRWAKRPPRP